MATADQIKALIKAHIEHEDDRFKTVVLQIAAYEATRGHETYARELKKYAEKIGAPKGNVFRLNQQTPMLLMTIPSDRLTDLIVSDEILERIERILNEFRNRNKLQKYGLKYPVRTDPDAHAKFISRKLQESRNQDLTQKQVAAIRCKDGLYLEFSSAVQHDLATKQLENLQKHIRLLNVKEDGDIVRATVYIPAGQETYFLEKIQEYGMPVADEESPKNNTLVSSIVFC